MAADFPPKELATYYAARLSNVAVARKNGVKDPITLSKAALGLTVSYVSNDGHSQRAGGQISPDAYHMNLFEKAKKAGLPDSTALAQSIRDPKAYVIAPGEEPNIETTNITLGEVLENQRSLETAARAVLETSPILQARKAVLEALLLANGIPKSEAAKLAAEHLRQELGLEAPFSLKGLSFLPVDIGVIATVKKYAIPLGAGLLGITLISAIIKRS